MIFPFSTLLFLSCVILVSDIIALFYVLTVNIVNIIMNTTSVMLVIRVVSKFK